MSVGFRGTSSNQDSRFSNKETKLLKTLKFPEELSLPVDMNKVNMEAMRPWIVEKVTELLTFEDEVVDNLVINLLEEENLNPKLIQIQLTPFLEGNTGPFMLELWTLLLSAQGTPSGVPQAFLDKQAEEARKRRELEREYDAKFRQSRWERGSRSREWEEEERGRSSCRYGDNTRYRPGSARSRESHRSRSPRRYERRSPSPRRRHNNNNNYDRGPPYRGGRDYRRHGNSRRFVSIY